MKRLKQFLKRLFKQTELDKQIKEDPLRLICPTCLGNCGQCGITGMIPNIEDGHWIYLKDLKKHNDYKQGWSGLISSFGINK